MGRPTLDEVRARLLDAGVEVLQRALEDPDNYGPIGHIDLKAVAAAAGYRSPGMIYTVWTNLHPELSPREAFVHDLTARLIDIETWNQDLQAKLVSLLGAGKTPDEATRDLANHTLKITLEDEIWTANSALRALGRGSELRQRFADTEATAARASASLYDDALVATGRRFRPGIDATSLAVLLRALESGIAASIDLNPDLVQHHELTWEGIDGWSLFAIAVRELFLALTEPIADDPIDDGGIDDG